MKQSYYVIDARKKHADAMQVYRLQKYKWIAIKI